ncbi:MAG: hypothetical protein AW07_02018 [Candidatus Accumulibacter sp. SK-11]|nr:MAG: hypothetical protein AW07_02018 [Candidatus Accumulibacter sp. SK-11]
MRRRPLAVVRLVRRVVVAVGVVAGVRVAVVVAVVVAVPCVMRRVQDQRATDVYRQSQRGNDDRLGKLDRLRRQQSFDRTAEHQQRHAEQEDGAGEAGKDLDLPGAESETPIVGVTSGGRVGERRKADRHGM